MLDFGGGEGGQGEHGQRGKGRVVDADVDAEADADAGADADGDAEADGDDTASPDDTGSPPPVAPLTEGGAWCAAGGTATSGTTTSVSCLSPLDIAAGTTATDGTNTLHTGPLRRISP